MKNRLHRGAVAVACALACGPVLSYDPLTHSQMSEFAVDASILSSQEKLDQLGLRFSAADLRQRFLLPDGRSVPVRTAFAFGAEDEDSDWRAPNHFFNPLNNQPLTLLKFINATSPDWALEDTGEVPSTTLEVAPQI